MTKDLGTTGKPKDTPEGRVTGIGGVFYKMQNMAETRAWYLRVLGLETRPYGVNLAAKADPHKEESYSVWSPFKAETDYFAPSTSDFMINLRVDDMDAMVARLEREKVEILGGEDADYGRFRWIMDPNGIKLELWQQIGPAPDRSLTA